MKILFIADNFPELGSGSSVRNFYLLTSLTKEKTIDVVGLIDYKASVHPKNMKNVTYYILERIPMKFMKKLVCIISGFIPFIEQRKSMQLPIEIIKKMDKYDLIHISELNSYFVLEKYLKKTKASVKLILDAHNIEYTKMAAELRKKSSPYTFIGELFARNIRTLEVSCIKKMDHVIVCSPTDKQWYERYIPQQNITVIPNGIDVSYFNQTPVKHSKKKIVLFMGLLSYFPNQEGLKYYISQIHPAVKQKVDNFEFHIIGRNCPAWLKRMSEQDKSIKIFGFVPDQRPYILNASVCVAPLLSGSGTRLKILEYMALGQAVVSTSKGSEGINVENRKNILVADTTEAFTSAIVYIMRNEGNARKLGKNAQKLVREQYDWEKIGEELNRLYKKIS